MAGASDIEPGMKGREGQEMGHPHSFPVDALAAELDAARRGFAGRDAGEAARLLHRWLVWSQSAEPEAAMRWTWLVRKDGLDRDHEVLALWKAAEANRALRQEVETKTLWEHYQAHFFGWFLGRFDLSRARAVYTDHWAAKVLHGVWAVLAIVTAALVLGKPRDFEALLGVFAAFLAVVTVSGLVGEKLPAHAYFHSLVPRLGLAIGIGYLLLLGAPHLVQLVESSPRPESHVWAAVVALLAAAFLFIAVHLSRRVHPRLRWPALVRRSGSLLLLGLGYGALELLVLAPVLFAPELVCGAPDCFVHLTRGRLALCAAIALNLGVLLFLAWEQLTSAGGAGGGQAPLPEP